ncbi:MAG: COG1470 family protein, partial [Methanobacteriota archaeon]
VGGADPDADVGTPLGNPVGVAGCVGVPPSPFSDAPRLFYRDANPDQKLNTSEGLYFAKPTGATTVLKRGDLYVSRFLTDRTVSVPGQPPVAVAPIHGGGDFVPPADPDAIDRLPLVTSAGLPPALAILDRTSDTDLLDPDDVVYLTNVSATDTAPFPVKAGDVRLTPFWDSAAGDPVAPGDLDLGEAGYCAAVAPCMTVLADRRLAFADLDASGTYGRGDWLVLRASASATAIGAADVVVNMSALGLGVAPEGQRVPASTVGMPVVPLPITGRMTVHEDPDDEADESGVWTRNDTLVWDTDGLGSVSANDVRLSPEGRNSYGSRVQEEILLSVAHLQPGEVRDIDRVGGVPMAFAAGDLVTDLVVDADAFFVGDDPRATVGEGDAVDEGIVGDNIVERRVRVLPEPVVVVRSVAVAPNDVDVASETVPVVRVRAKVRSETPTPATLVGANLTVFSPSGPVVLTKNIEEARVTDTSLDPFQTVDLEWALQPGPTWENGTHRLLVAVDLASDELGSDRSLAVDRFHVGVGTNFFSASGFHPPADHFGLESMMGFAEVTDSFYNSTTYYHTDGDRAYYENGQPRSWRFQQGGQAGQTVPIAVLAMKEPLDLANTSAAFLSFRHRYFFKAHDGAPGSTEAGVVEITTRELGVDDAGDERWVLLRPVTGGYGAIKTDVATVPDQFGGQAANPHYNPLVDDVCRRGADGDAARAPPCASVGYVGASPRYAVSALRPEGWDVATFDLTPFVGQHDVRVRWRAGVTSTPDRNADWQIDYVVVTPHRLEIGPAQAYAVGDGIDKSFRIGITNRGGYTDTVNLSYERGVLPPGWLLEVARADGTPLVDAAGRSVGTFDVDPGETKEVRVRVVIPVARTFATVQNLFFRTTSQRDPASSAESVIRLDFAPRLSPDLSIVASEVRISPDPIRAGATGTVNVRVRNLGDAATEASLTLLDVPELGSPKPLRSLSGEAAPRVRVLAGGF